jgi:hypothetical protein
MPAATLPAVEFSVVTDSVPGRRVRLDERPLAIGTAPGSDVRLPRGPEAAPEHALIWRHGTDVILHALGDTPCIVNGEPMTWAALDRGDRIETGGVTLRML